MFLGLGGMFGLFGLLWLPDNSAEAASGSSFRVSTFNFVLGGISAGVGGIIMLVGALKPGTHITDESGNKVARSPGVHFGPEGLTF